MTPDLGNRCGARCPQTADCLAWGQTSSGRVAGLSSTVGPRAATFLLGARAGRVSCRCPETPACELTLVHRPVSTGVTQCAFLREKSLPSEPDVRARECGAGFPPRHSFQEEDGRHQHQMLGRAAHAGSSRCRQLAHLCLVFPGGGKGVVGRARGPQHTVCRPRALTSLAPPQGRARGCSQRCWRPRGHCEAGPTTAGLASAPCCPVLPQAQEHRSGD